MADLFSDEFTQQQDVAEDPAAEFLAQQESEIAGLESDVMGSAPQADMPDTGNDFDPITNGFGANNDTDFAQLESNDSGLFGGDSEIVNGEQELEERLDPSQAYAAIAAADARLEQLRAEPEKIRIWREENTKLIAEKDLESERKQQEWLSQARKELEDWERNRIEQLEKTKKSNRTAEEQFVKDRDLDTPGSEWERVSKLCDFNPKSAKGSKDVTRMRSTLLHLKQHPRPVTVTEVNGN